MHILVNDCERQLMQFIFELKKRDQIKVPDYDRFLNHCRSLGGVRQLVLSIMKPVKNEKGEMVYQVNPLPIPHYFKVWQQRQLLRLISACLHGYKTELENQRILTYYKKLSEGYLKGLRKSILKEIQLRGLSYLFYQSDLSDLSKMKLKKFPILSDYPKIYFGIQKYQVIARAGRLLDPDHFNLELNPSSKQSYKNNISNNKPSAHQMLYQYRLFLKKNESCLRKHRDSQAQTFFKILGLGAISILSLGIAAYPAYYAFFGNGSTRGIRLAKNAIGHLTTLSL